ncbi:VC2046/SO_2500 family protein [Alteromonas sp. CYL-A6]|uniref:VC2046/SO_2500 family protein n=1 Tax=Alteromonas nitratireducens TaxID=3390813 RepID=UPI0034A98A59
MAIQAEQLDFPSRLEWQGKFADAAGNGALFSLYLSLQYGANVGRPSITPVAEARVTDDRFPERLNTYRRPPLKASDSSFRASHQKSSLLNSRHSRDVLLLETCCPEPLSMYNDHKRIPDDVLANCSLATRQRLQQAMPVLEEDNTLLEEVIEQARAFEAA